jgi:hypothetical protein
MNKTKKQIPHFRSEAEENKFWSTADSTDYIDWSKAKLIEKRRRKIYRDFLAGEREYKKGKIKFTSNIKELKKMLK